MDLEESDKEDQGNAYGAQTIQPQALSDQDQQNPTKGKEKDAKSPSEVCCFFRSYPSQSGSMNTGLCCQGPNLLNSEESTPLSNHFPQKKHADQIILSDFYIRSTTTFEDESPP